MSYFDYNTLELQKYGKGFNSYTDLLNIYNTKHDFGEFDWKRATPVTAPTVYEWEDKIDMGSVKLESKAFMYDGTEHSLAISGTCLLYTSLALPKPVYGWLQRPRQIRVHSIRRHGKGSRSCA